MASPLQKDGICEYNIHSYNSLKTGFSAENGKKPKALNKIFRIIPKPAIIKDRITPTWRFLFWRANSPCRNTKIVPIPLIMPVPIDNIVV